MTFKIADGFVNVYGEVDKRSVRESADRVTDGIESGLTSGTARTRIRNAGGQLGEDAGRAAGDRGGRNFSDRLERSFKRDSGGKFAKIGAGLGIQLTTGASKALSGGLMESISGVFKVLPSELKAGIAVAGAGIAAIWLPAIGAAVSGGILAGLGTGVVAAGVAMAFQDPKINDAASKLGIKVTDYLNTASQAFIPATMNAIEEVSRAWDDVAADVGRAFASSAKYLDPLTDGLTGFIRNVMPGLTHAIEAAGPAVLALSKGLKDTGATLGKFFDDMSKNGDEAAAGLELAFFAVNATIEVFGDTINGLASGFGKVTEWGKKITGVGASLTSWMPGIGRQFEEWNALWTKLNQTANGENLQTAARKLGDVSTATSEATEATAELNRHEVELRTSFASATSAAGSLTAALNELNGGAVSAEQAAIAYQAAIDDATVAIDKNGKTTDVNTEKGRANRQALLDQATTAQQYIGTLYEQTKATQGEEAANRAATTASANARAQLIATAIQMGMSKTAAEAYADELLGIPGQVNTKAALDKANAEAQIQDLKDSLARVPGSKTITIKVKADLPPGIAMGALMRADGGVIERYASGGIRTQERHDAQIARGGAWRVWAEPETKGESYIPLAPEKRTKSVQVLRRTNELLGSPLADPGGSGGGQMSAMPVGGGAMTGRSPNTGTTYYFAPGAITLDASRIKSMRDLEEMVRNLKPTARQFSATGRNTNWGTA